MTPSTLTDLQEAIFKKRPVLKKITLESRDKSLADYAGSYGNYASKVPLERKAELIGAIQDKTTRLLGEAVGKSVAEQLARFYYLSTTDHHGPLVHPFFVHANLLAAAAQLERRSDHHDNLIVLACSNVSLNNSSFPRSLLFHGRTGESYERLHFFPASHRIMPVFRHPPYDRHDIERMRSSTTKMVAGGKISHAAGDRLKDILQTIYASPEALAAASYSDQVARTNRELWQQFFAHSGVRLPNLIYLNLEEIVSQLLLAHHIASETVLRRFIFSEDLQEEMIAHFDGIPGAFSLKDHSGTFMFWYFPEGGKVRIPLWPEKGFLVSPDRRHKVPLTPEVVADLLARQELIPSIMLCLVVLAGYYGAKCLGGFSQTTYLVRIDAAYRELFPEERATTAPPESASQSLCGDFTIGFLQREQGLVPATGLDFILYGSERSWKKFVATAKNLNISEGISLMLPDMYKILYGESERSPGLSELTATHIWDRLGLAEKVNPCLDIHDDRAL